FNLWEVAQDETATVEEQESGAFFFHADWPNDGQVYGKTVLFDRLVLDVGRRQVMRSAGLKTDEKLASPLRRQLLERRSFARVQPFEKGPGVCSTFGLDAGSIRSWAVARPI